VVVALARECRSLGCAPSPGVVTTLRDRAIVVVAGIGGANAARGAAELVAAGASGLMSWGCAGALAPQAVAGDLCIPTAVVSAQGERLAVDVAWRARLLDALGPHLAARGGTLLSRERVAASPQDKQALAAAHPDAVGVDMESGAVAAVARAHALPFLAVRAVVDPLELALPSSALAAGDATGGRALMAVGRALGRRPDEIGDLLRLARAFRAAMRTLARVASLTDDDFLLTARASRLPP
jgi:hopanoid-associated phosphorylase